MRIQLVCLSLILMACCCDPCRAQHATADKTATLRVGDVAPKLEIEHWIQNPKGTLKPVTTFLPGTVYVIEFWATDCPPCLAFMPKLAKIQRDFGAKKVRVISISHEAPSKIDTFLKKNENFAKITSEYSLTTDPAGSAKKQYMHASGMFAIPACVIVGKTGRIEWLGSPQELKDPLTRIVEGKWDRKAFAIRAEMLQEIGAITRKISQQRHGSRDDQLQAIKLIEKTLDESPTPNIPEFGAIRFMQLALLIGTDQTPKAVQLIDSRLKSTDPAMTLECAGAIAMIRPDATGVDRAELVQTAVEKMVALADSPFARKHPELRFSVFSRLSMLHSSSGQHIEAIAALEKAKLATKNKSFKTQAEQMIQRARQQLKTSKKTKKGAAQ